MSLINKMLQDLDKRHAADGGGKAPTQQLRPVPARRNRRRILWEIGAGLLVAAGWAVWVLYQISPRSVVTDLVFQSQAKRPYKTAGSFQAPAGPPVQPPPAAQAVPVQAPASPAPPPAVVAPAPAAPAVSAAAPVPAETASAEPAKVGTMKFATEIATPFKQKRPERALPAETAPAARSASKGKPASPALAAVEQKPVSSAPAPASSSGVPAARTQDPASIDKQMRVATPAERAEIEFRKATALLNQGRVAEAIDGYKATLQQDGAHAPGRQALVGLLLEHQRIDEAQQFLQDGLNRDPGRSNYAMLSARIQVERGDLQGAHELLSKHAASAANSADYHAFDAAVLQRLGRHNEAVAAYQAALRLAPRAGLWWMGLGISLQADNRRTEALEAFRRARAAGGLSPDLQSFVDQRMKLLQ